MGKQSDDDNISATLQWTPHRELAMTYYISRMLKYLPNILAISGVSTRQKEGKENTQPLSCEHPWHISPTTLTQTQC